VSRDPVPDLRVLAAPFSHRTKLARRPDRGHQISYPDARSRDGVNIIEIQPPTPVRCSSGLGAMQPSADGSRGDIHPGPGTDRGPAAHSRMHFMSMFPHTARQRVLARCVPAGVRPKIGRSYTGRKRLRGASFSDAFPAQFKGHTWFVPLAGQVTRWS